MPSPLILLHDLGCDSRFWQHQSAHLASLRWLLWVPDLPYHGGPVEGVEPSLAGLTGWVAQALRGQPTVLIGHSLGGMIALQIAREAPKLVRGLVLVETLSDAKLGRQFLAAGPDPGRYADLRAGLAARRQEITARMPGETHGTLEASVRGFNAVPWLAQVRCPVLALYGGRGRYRPGEEDVLRQQLQLHRLGGPTEVAIMAGGSHFVHLEYPRETNVALDRWIKAHFGAPVI